MSLLRFFHQFSLALSPGINYLGKQLQHNHFLGKRCSKAAISNSSSSLLLCAHHNCFYVFSSCCFSSVQLRSSLSEFLATHCFHFQCVFFQLFILLSSTQYICLVSAFSSEIQFIIWVRFLFNIWTLEWFGVVAECCLGHQNGAHSQNL